jgi:ATP-dependent helicase/nuclease subunit A
MMNPDALLQADTAARAAALDAQRSILLQAPAGSGKTAVLVLRFLRLLSQVDDPGEILAITFTRKAAAEMRARVLRALRAELDPDDPATPALRAEATRALRHGDARGWDLTQDPERLRIQTIDSFNFWLAGQLPLASKAGGLLQVTERAEDLYRAAARATLAADHDVALSASIELLFERLDNDWNAFERDLAALLERRAHWLPFVLNGPPETLCSEVDASLEAVVHEALQRACGVLPAPLRRLLAELPGIGTLGTDTQSLASWRALTAAVLSKTGGLRRSLQARHLDAAYAEAGARAQLKAAIERLERTPGAEPLLCELRELPPAHLGVAETQALAALARVLRNAALELQTQFAQAGVVDYTYIAGAAREALGAPDQPTDLALRAGLRLRHILVDEFQDTSRQQFELLQRLTAAWECADGRSLFVVGDPMQSIYRFREAEVGLFITARERGIGSLRLEPLQLAFNFRASAALVSWSNALFARVFPPADDVRSGAVTFSASLPRPDAPAGGDGTALHLRLFPDAPAAEVRAVVAHIEQLRARDPRASIAVLVMAHSHATPIVTALAARGIGALGLDLVPLSERQVVRDLVQLGRALADLADRSAWLAVLRAPWCGLRLETLTHLSGPEDPQLLFEALQDENRLARIAAPERARLERVRTVLAQALAHSAEADSAATLERTWLALGAADAYSAAELTDAQALFAALAAGSTGTAGHAPRELAALLQHLCSQVKPAEPHPVQIMTIHRAKGLEFDHVLLPALERNTRGSERSLLRWIDLARKDGGTDLLLAPAAAVGADTVDRIGDYICQREDERTRAERTRLLYVAVTRARRTLWLSGAPERNSAGALKPGARSLLQLLGPALEEVFEVVTDAPGGAAAAASATQRRLRAGWQPTALPESPSRTRLAMVETLPAAPEFSWVRERQRHIGTIVHARLAQFATLRELPRPAGLESERAGLMEQLRLAGVAQSERAQACDLILAALRTTLEDARGRWLLSGAHRGAHSELALTGIADGRLQSVRVDRSFVDAEGTRWVIDYKTSRHEGADREGFLANELERYREQLTTYAALARGLGPEPVRAGLYFPLMGEFRELR